MTACGSNVPHPKRVAVGLGRTGKHTRKTHATRHRTAISACSAATTDKKTEKTTVKSKDRTGAGHRTGVHLWVLQV